MAKDSCAERGIGLVANPLLWAYLASISYAVYTRTPDDFVDSLVPIVTIQTIACQFWLTQKWAASYMRSVQEFSFRRAALSFPGIKPKGFVALFIAIPIISSLTGLVFYGLGVTVKDSYLWLLSVASVKAINLSFGTILTIALSGLFYMARERTRFIFGVAEACVGLYLAVSKITEEVIDPASWALGLYITIVAAGIFLIVRGIDDMRTGLKRESLDAFVGAFIKYADQEFGINCSNDLAIQQSATPLRTRQRANKPKPRRGRLSRMQKDDT